MEANQGSWIPTNAEVDEFVLRVNSQVLGEPDGWIAS
jgi:hypothetical protein